MSRRRRRVAATGGAATASPTDFAGLVIWLDATQIALQTDNTDLIDWYDVSGNGRDFGSGGKPSYRVAGAVHGTNAVVTFDRTAFERLTFPLSSGTPPSLTSWTLLTAIKFTSSSGYSGPFGYRHTAIAGPQIVTGSYDLANFRRQAIHWDGSAEQNVLRQVDAGTPVPSSNYSIDAYTSAPQIRVDGVASALEAGAAGYAFNTLAKVGTSNEYMGGHYGEILLYDSVLSDGDIAALESYLMTKWKE